MSQTSDTENFREYHSAGKGSSEYSVKKTYTENFGEYHLAGKGISEHSVKKTFEKSVLYVEAPPSEWVVATNTYFSNTRSIEGYWYAQVFIGLTSRRTTVIGIKTESEFAEAY